MFKASDAFKQMYLSQKDAAENNYITIDNIPSETAKAMIDWTNYGFLGSFEGCEDLYVAAVNFEIPGLKVWFLAFLHL